MSLFKLFAVLSCVCFLGRLAQAAAPGVTFYPTVINFGQIPTGEEPTQLLTVRFSRAMFPPDHLPSLRLQGSNGPAVLLFSRTVEPDAVTLVYRITFPSYTEYGPFQYQLILVKAGAPNSPVAPCGEIFDPGVLVQGEKVLGLTGFPQVLDFGPIRYGKSAVKEFHIGFSCSNMIHISDESKPLKHSAWPLLQSLSSMSVASTSPYITATKKDEIEINASAWADWKIILSPKAPQKKLEATLTFQTGDGYFFTVPVTVDLSGPGYPIPPWEPVKQKKH